MTEPIIGWARPLAYVPPTYHGVVEVELLGSVRTACVGRWSSREPWHYVEGRDRDRDDEGNSFAKCDACSEAADEQLLHEFIVSGGTADIAEQLERAPSWPMSASDFDLSDLDETGGES